MKNALILWGGGILFTVIMISCLQKTSNHVTQHDFIKENMFTDFTKWRNWSMTYGSGKYIAIFNCDSVQERLIFWRKDSVYARLTLPDTMSTILKIDAMHSDSLWIKYYTNINLDDLKSHINFVLKYNMEKVLYYNEPDLISFKSDSIDLVYLFTPQDSEHILFKNKLTPNWYSFE